MRLFLKSIFLLCIFMCLSRFVMAMPGGPVIGGPNEHEIFKAIPKNDIEKVVNILLEDNNIVNVRGDNGETPLHRVWTPEMTELLLKYGAEVDARDNDGRTPLNTQYIVSTEVARVLVKYGADINARDNDGKTVIFLPGSNENTKLFLSRGADVKTGDQNGRTPLHSAIYIAMMIDLEEKNLKNIQLLLDYGANVNAKDKYGKTALYYIIHSILYESLIAYEIIEGMKLMQLLMRYDARLGVKASFANEKQDRELIIFAEAMSERDKLSLGHLETIKQLVINEVSDSLSEDVLKALDVRITEKRQRGSGDDSGGGTCPKSFQ